MAKKERTYRIKEAAKVLGISERSVFRYIHDKKLRATKIGFWRMTKADLDAFVVERTNIRKHR